MKLKALSCDFYLHDRVEELAPELLGKVLVKKQNGVLASGIITEVEAYAGDGRDKACHAHKGPTKRNQVMFEKGGIAYVYLCYGIHTLFNIVTNKKGYPDAILVRATEPVGQIKKQLQRRNLTSLKPQISDGPGKLTQALGIDMKDNGVSLQSGRLMVCESPREFLVGNILRGKRIGIEYAGEDIDKLWRFALD